MTILFPNIEMKICKLHMGLYILADHTGRVPYNLAILRAKIFPGEHIDVEKLIHVLEDTRLLTIEGKPLSIRLIPWPTFGRCPTRKGDQLQASAIGDPFQPVAPGAIPPDLQKKRNQQNKDAKIRRIGLAGIPLTPGFKVFIQNWPVPFTHKLMETTAWKAWKQLERAQALADISLILQALKSHPPIEKMWPSTWLKKKFWRQPKTPISCRTCFDEGIIYGPRPDGSKGALPCPKCKT